MGRCYEFGVAIAPGCDHAMRVVDAGGRCQCPACGTGCDGRFSGCAAVVAMPGYVPASAPASLPSVTPASPATVAGAVDEPPPLPSDDVAARRAADDMPSLRAADDIAARRAADDMAALRAEMHTWLDEVRAVLDEALAEITRADAAPRTVIQLSTLRRRLANLKRQQSASAAPPPSD